MRKAKSKLVGRSYRAELMSKELKINTELKALKKQVYDNVKCMDSSWEELYKAMNLKAIDLKTVQSRIANLNRNQMKEEKVVKINNNNKTD